MSKNRDSKDKQSSIQDKFKQLFKLGKNQPTSISTHELRGRNELTLTFDKIRDVSKQSQLNHRLRSLKEFGEVILHCRLDDNAIDKLWVETKDLLMLSCPLEARHQVLNFYTCLIKGQHEKLGIHRSHFFNVIAQHNVPEDLVPRLEMFTALSENGKNILYFEDEVGTFMLLWMPEVMSTNKSSQYLPVLLNLIKFNAAYLDPDIISGFVTHTCWLSNITNNEEDVQLCLDVLDAIVCYSYLPTNSLLCFIKSLCRVVNLPQFSDSTLKLMRKFLGTHLGHSGVSAMTQILQDRQNYSDHSLLRGAVFFIGMCLWGSKKVTSLKHTPSSVLPSFICALQCENSKVAIEVLLSVSRLIKKYGNELELLTWELLLDILDAVISLSDFQNIVSLDFSKLESQIHETINSIETLYENSEFRGSVDRLFEIIEKVSNHRPEASVLRLIQFRSQSIQPMYEGWIDKMRSLMDRYYKMDERSNIRIKALHVLSSVLCATRHLYEDDLIDKVVLIHLSSLNSDHDVTVRNVAVQLLVDLAIDCTSKRCLDLLEIIEKVISHPFNALSTSVKDQPDIVHILHENELRDVLTGVQGLIEIFQRKMFSLPSVYAIKAHKMLIAHLMTHYRSPIVFGLASTIRYVIFEHLLKFRANQFRQIGILPTVPKDENKDTKHSSYILCESESDASRLISSSSFPSCTPSCISVKPIFEAIITCLRQEKEWIVLNLVLIKLTLMFQNKTLVLSAEGVVESLCISLCELVSNRKLCLPENLNNQPKKFSRSDFHSYIFPILSALTSYHSYLSIQMQRNLIKCLEFGLVSPCAGMCIVALTDCTLEMHDIMYKLLPEILLSLSKISATVTIASSILEFLSTLIMLPALYASFVEDQYMSIFAIALPYTNPFKFNHYIVSLSHHIIAMWFLKCRLPYRRNFVKFIIKGLNANVVTPCEDNNEALQRRRSSSLNEQQSQTQNTSLRKMTLLQPHGGNRSTESKLPHDDAMMSFHLELTDTCLDFLARYVFSTCSALSNRSPVAEFLLKEGQTTSWLVGCTIITITTSGCGSKISHQGLCKTCFILCKKSTTEESSPADTAEIITTEDKNLARRRHRSAFVQRNTNEAQSSFPTLSNKTRDDSVVHHSSSFSSTSSSSDSRSRGNTASSCDSNISSGAMIHAVEEPATQNIDKLMSFSERKGEEKEDVSNVTKPSRAPRRLCNCWCQGWAEIQIRRPTGNTSWMLRIQNQLNLANSQSDFPLADIASLFLPSKLETSDSFEKFDVSGHHRIDSESLGDNEYEAMYQEHFEAGSPQKLRRSKSVKANVKKNQDFCGVDSEDASENVSSTDTENKDQIPVRTPPPSSPATAVNKQGIKSDKLAIDAEDVVGIKRISPCKTDRILTIPEEKVPQTYNRPTKPKLDVGDNVAKSKLPSPPALSRKSLSPPMSPQKSQLEVSATSQSSSILRGRGYTISVMTPTEKVSTLEFPRSTNSLKREMYKTGINPSFIFLQLFHNCYFGNSRERPLILPKDEAMNRALMCLDCIPPYETHKIGIIYIDKGQCNNETAILANEYGSVRYMNFLQGIGKLIRLTDVDPKLTYIGGLDSREDGKFAYLWHDDMMQVIFHVATLMPTRENDPACGNKKRHIGNDFVLIVYNDSGEDFQISTMKGQFIYACVVIEPVDHESNVVSIKSKPDLSELIEHSDQKIVSDRNLSIIVRQLALHANLASRIFQSQVKTSRDPFSSNWLERRRQINRIRTKILNQQQTESTDGSSRNSNQMDFTDYV